MTPDFLKCLPDLDDRRVTSVVHLRVNVRLSIIMANVMMLFGSGGHSSEMLMLIQNAKLSSKIDLKEVAKLICVVSEDDKLIGEKIKLELSESKLKRKLEIVPLKRGRRVGQSFLTAIWTTLIGILHSTNIVRAHEPNICLTNGPAISVTISLAIRFLQAITLNTRYRCEIVYIESFCRTKTLSLSGRLIYHLRLASQFYVQWPALLAAYPRAKYRGILV